MKFKVAYIEITNKCNLNCRTCYNQSGLNTTLQELSLRDITFIVSQLVSAFRCERIVFSGGEPFLHSQILQIIDITKEYPYIDFGFVTNGTMGNAKIIRSLCESHNISIQLSLDGSNEVTNSKTRGTGNFIKSISFLKSISPLLPKTTLMMTISRLNYEDVENFYTFAVNNNVRPQFSFIGKSGNATHNWADKELSATEKVEIINKLESLNSRYGCSSSIPYCTSGCILSNASEEYSIGIQPDGTIIPCQYLYNSKKYAIGNILCDDYSSLKKGMDKIRSLAIQRENTDFNCSHCILNKKCRRGCMAQAEYYAMDPLGVDGLCELRVLSAIKSIFSNNQ